MNNAEKQIYMQSLVLQLSASLARLRDALTDLSLTLKDGQLQLDDEAAHEAGRLAEATLRACAKSMPQTPPN